MSAEVCREKLEELARHFSENRGSRNEATTRLHLINSLFFDCLGWSRDDCVCEQSQDGLFADYTFSTTRRVLIVEAKKEGDYFELPIEGVQPEYAIPTLCRDYSSLRKAIKQASQYCQDRGVPIGAVCNGHQIVAFVATRGDGRSPLDGRALVFPHYEDMLSRFVDLWNALSKNGIAAGYLESRLLGRAPSHLPPKLSAEIPGYPGIKGRNAFQADLQIVSELVLEDLARGQDIEEEFLRQCYCNSGVLSQYALLSKDILRARYSALFADEKGAPTLVAATTTKGISADLVADSLSRRPILLIGDVGVGKTTFTRHLVKVDASDVFADALSIYLDLGSTGALAGNLQEFILEEIATQMRENFAVDVGERNFVRGVYHRDLVRFGSGIYADLKNIDPTAFLRKEIEFLEEKVRRKDAHLQACISHVAKGRRKQVVIFIDNADQREYPVQQEAFLIAQELATTWPATIFIALRPETFYTSLRTGALSGYHPKAFTIAPPRIDDVIDKRLLFGLKIAAGEVPISSLPKTVSIQFNKLTWIIKAFRESLKTQPALMEGIENISAGNVRQALDLVKCFFGSGHVDTQKIIEFREKSGRYNVPLHEFMRAVIYGDSTNYDPDRSPVCNLFDVSTNDPKDHFALPLVLSVVMSLSTRASSEGFVETHTIYEALQNLGYAPHQIDSAMQRGLARKMIESGRARERTFVAEIPQAVRLTSSGAYHVQKLLRMFVYADAVVVDTPILDKHSRIRIRDVSDIKDRLMRADEFRQYLDVQWGRSGIDSPAFDWPSISSELLDDIRTITGRVTHSL